MKNHWVTFLTGRVLVKAEGKGLERLLNMCIRAQIIVWKVKRFKKDGIFFYIRLSDLHKLRHIARDSDCSLSFVRGSGLPFLKKRLMKNSGFAVGMLIFLIVITILSNITWGIQIKGTNPETEHQIRQELDKLQIRVGTFHFFNQDLEKIQRELTERVENITWIGVELRGTTFQFQVVEKTDPEQQERLSPRHLVANKRAVISEMFIEKGKPVVKIHQHVEKGQLLVSGIISGDSPEGNKEDQKEKKISDVVVPAQGKVWGKTWYQSQAEFPLKTTFQVFTGEEKRTHLIELGSIKIPVWGFKKVSFKNKEVEYERHPVRFVGWELPIAYIEKTEREKEQLRRSLTKKEAIEAGMELARRDLKKQLPKDARLDKEILLHEKVENGKVMLSVHFQVIENIAEEKPINQGD